MFVVIVDVLVRAQFVNQFREAVVRQGENSLALEPGCLGFDILQDPDNPALFTLVETYEDAPAFYETHRRTPHFQAYATTTAPWVETKNLRPLARIWPSLKK